MRQVTLLATGTLIAVGLTGCGQPHAEEVRAAASTFYEAHGDGDGSAACSQLAPKTRSALEDSAGRPCEQAVLEEKVPTVSEVGELHVFGTQAEVEWDGETTFLARFQDGWKVMAAACKPLAGRPYDCAVSGG